MCSLLPDDVDQKEGPGARDQRSGGNDCADVKPIVQASFADRRSRYARCAILKNGGCTQSLVPPAPFARLNRCPEGQDKEQTFETELWRHSYAV
jgi:hypothetical protein